MLYGFGNPLSKIGFESITVLWCLGIRFSGAAALIFDDVAVLPQVTVTGWLVVAYLALLCTCLSYVLQNTALTRLFSYTVSLLQCTQPVLTAACSYLLLGEKLSAVGLAGAALIVACVVLENWQSGRKQTA